MKPKITRRQPARHEKHPAKHPSGCLGAIAWLLLIVGGLCLVLGVGPHITGDILFDGKKQRMNSTLFTIGFAALFCGGLLTMLMRIYDRPAKISELPEHTQQADEDADREPN